jgi:hypothetical protein
MVERFMSAIFRLTRGVESSPRVRPVRGREATLPPAPSGPPAKGPVDDGETRCGVRTGRAAAGLGIAAIGVGGLLASGLGGLLLIVTLHVFQHSLKDELIAADAVGFAHPVQAVQEVRGHAEADLLGVSVLGRSMFRHGDHAYEVYQKHAGFSSKLTILVDFDLRGCYSLRRAGRFSMGRDAGRPEQIGSEMGPERHGMKTVKKSRRHRPRGAGWEVFEVWAERIATGELHRTGFLVTDQMDRPRALAYVQDASDDGRRMAWRTRDFLAGRAGHEVLLNMERVTMLAKWTHGGGVPAFLVGRLLLPVSRLGRRLFDGTFGAAAWVRDYGSLSDRRSYVSRTGVSERLAAVDQAEQTGIVPRGAGLEFVMYCGRAAEVVEELGRRVGMNRAAAVKTYAELLREQGIAAAVIEELSLGEIRTEAEASNGAGPAVGLAVTEVKKQKSDGVNRPIGVPAGKLTTERAVCATVAAA